MEGTRLWLTRCSLLLPAGYWLQSRRCVCVCDPCTPCFFVFFHTNQVITHVHFSAVTHCSAFLVMRPVVGAVVGVKSFYSPIICNISKAVLYSSSLFSLFFQHLLQKYFFEHPSLFLSCFYPSAVVEVGVNLQFRDRRHDKYKSF